MSVEVVDDGAVRRITLARPEKRNAMTIAMFDAVTHAVEGAVADDAVRVVVIRGSGRPLLFGRRDRHGWIGRRREAGQAPDRTPPAEPPGLAPPDGADAVRGRDPDRHRRAGLRRGHRQRAGAGGRPRGRGAIRTVLGAVRGPRLHARQRHDVPPPPADRRRPRQGDDPARQAGRRHARGRVGPREPGGRRRRARRRGRGGRAGVRARRRPSRSAWPSS